MAKTAKGRLNGELDGLKHKATREKVTGKRREENEMAGLWYDRFKREKIQREKETEEKEKREQEIERLKLSVRNLYVLSCTVLHSLLLHLCLFT